MEDPEHVFSNGLHLANMAVSSNILIDSWNAISETRRDIPGTIIKHHPNYNIIAFVGSPRSDLEKKTGLVPISKISDFQLQRSDTQPSFWINEAAFSLFNFLGEEFDRRQEEVETSFKPDASISLPAFHAILSLVQSGHIPYIITGHGLNGCVASLFTLSLLTMLHPTKNELPLCITFGSPLLGDTTFQQAIFSSPTWNSCFLHVVHKDDCVLRSFPTTGQNPYKPFGTYLLCSESGCACFQAPDSVIELLKHKSRDIVAGNQESQTFDYKEVIERLEKLLLHRNVSSFLGHEVDSFKAGIAAQITAAGLWQRQQQNEGIHALIENIANHEQEVVKRQREDFDPAKELNRMKFCLSLLQKYMDTCKVNGEGLGYYDRFKNAEERLENTVDKFKTYLTVYWEEVVENAVKRPQKASAPLRMRWLYGGTNYRWIVEPLDIAEHYRRGEENYSTHGRSKHYELLEKWLKDHQNYYDGPSQSRVVVTVTEDSCFWAHVEEAIRSCRLLGRPRPGAPHDSEVAKLFEFEEYVMDLIQKGDVAPDIFFEKSSYMQWWREYQDKVSHQSPLVDYMKAGHYKGYGKGFLTD